MSAHKWQRQFYNSKPWRYMRAFVIDRDSAICHRCGKDIFDIPEVHHIVELTEANYQDPAISLNPELLVTLHHSCHDTVHERLQKNEKESIVNDDLSIDYSKRMQTATTCGK